MNPSKPLSVVLDMMQAGDLGPCFIVHEPSGYGTTQKSLTYAPDDANTETAIEKLKNYAGHYFYNNPAAFLKIEFFATSKANNSYRYWHNITGDNNLQAGGMQGFGGFGSVGGMNGMGGGMQGFQGLGMLQAITDKQLELERQRFQIQLDAQERRWEEREKQRELERKAEEMIKMTARLKKREAAISKKSDMYGRSLAIAGMQVVERLAQTNPQFAGFAGLLGIEVPPETETPPPAAEPTQTPPPAAPAGIGQQLDKVVTENQLTPDELTILTNAINAGIQQISANRSGGNSNDVEPDNGTNEPASNSE